jgi:hypothetical protein
MIEVIVQLGAAATGVAIGLLLTRAALALCLRLTFGRGPM